jgi:hypothetical protein
VTFSASVTGVVTGDFKLVPGGALAGSPGILSATGSGSSYTVTSSSGTGSGTLGLNLVDGDSIKDGVGVSLGGAGGGNGNFTGGVFTFVRSLSPVPAIHSGPPVPTIDSGPPRSPGWTTTTNVTFAVSDGQAGVSFLCKLDGGSFVSCSSPRSYSRLAQGSHVFQVEGRNGFGTSVPVSWSWRIDTVPPPVPRFSGGPVDPTNQTSASFTVSDSDHTASLYCSLDGASYAPCASPLKLSGLGEGQHSYRVVARDQAGTQSGAETRSWFVDLTKPPAPTIAFGPPPSSSSTSASFMFFAVDRGHDGSATTYRCSLDGSAYTPCYLLVGYSHLSQTQHSFEVEAVDRAGNVSGPTGWTWLVDTVVPTVQFMQTAPNPDVNTRPTFEFAGSDPGGSGVAGYECDVDDTGWAACTSPDTLDNLSVASHTFQVETIDDAGNVSIPVGYTWTITPAQTDENFTMAGDVNAGTSGDLYPGGPALAIPIKISNPNSVPIDVTSITVSATTGSLPAGCQAGWFVVAQSNVSSTNIVTVPANGSVVLPQPNSSNTGTVTAPTIEMTDSGPQNACAGATFQYSFAGSGHS